MLKTHWQPILWTILILVVCFTPGSQVPKANFLNIPNIDKWAHLVLFTIWSFLMAKSYHQQANFSKKEALVKVVAYGLELGAIIELCQAYFITNRSGEFFDFIADGFGVALGIIIFLKIFGEKAFKNIKN